VPPLTGRVVDQAGALPPDAERRLDDTLRSFEARKGSQVAVLIVQSTAPQTIEEYSIRVAEAWKIGRKKIDDGAILVVALGDRALRIEVGYGLEGALSDLVSKRIVEDIVKPHFRDGDVPGGVEAGVDAMLRVIDGEALPAPAASRRDRGNGGGGIGGIIPILFFVLFGAGALARAIFGRVLGGVLGGGVAGALGWIATGSLLLGGAIGLAALVLILAGFGGGGGFHRGGPRGFGGLGGMGGGGFRGGGFGGFSGGGGRFGGGGASGRW
jgi:uncharacterized protein